MIIRCVRCLSMKRVSSKPTVIKVEMYLPKGNHIRKHIIMTRAFGLFVNKLFKVVMVLARGGGWVKNHFPLFVPGLPEEIFILTLTLEFLSGGLKTLQMSKKE